MEPVGSDAAAMTLAETAMRAWRERAEAPDQAITSARLVLRSGADQPSLGVRAGTALAAALLALHRPAEARAAARDALEAAHAGGLEIDPDVLCEAHRCMVRSAFLLDDFAAALRYAHLQLDAAERSGDVRLRAAAHSDSATVYGAIGLFERAVEHLRASIDLLDGDELGRLAAPLNNLGNVYLEVDRPDEALACFGRSRHAYLSIDNPVGAAIARSNEGRALVALRRFDDGVAALRDALSEFTGGGDLDYVPATHAKLAMAYARAGEALCAERCFDEAVAWHERGVGRAFEPDTRRDFGSFLLDHQRDRDALVQLVPALRLFEERAAGAGIASVLQLLARAHENVGDAPAALRDLKAYVAEREALELERGDLRARSQVIDLEVSLARQHEVSRLTTHALAEANRALRAQAERLERLSSTDHLTGLHNRRYLAGRLADEVARSERHGLDLSLVLIDVDSFKTVNDRYSHAMGDAVLVRIADMLRTSFRRSDVVARWGGEEFAVLLPSTVKTDAWCVAEKARRNVAAHNWGTLVGGLEVTVSVGVVSLLEDARLDLDNLLRLADLRLYMAKDGGRNRTVAEH